MADFVAVIRRAVDGLTDNTPEMRVKVYEKARSAVVRQLENMNPRPPEAMFKRQLDKLDDAIRQVEEEHGEALPVDTAADEAAGQAEAAHADIAPAEAAPVAADEPVVEAAPVQVSAPEPMAASDDDMVEPAHREAVEEAPHYQPAAVDEHVHHAANDEAFAAPAVDAGHHEPAAHAEPFIQHEPSDPAREEPAEAADAMAHAEPGHVTEPVADHVPAEAEEETDQPQHSAAANAAPEDDDPLLSHFDQPREPAIRHASNRVMEQPHFDAESEFPGDEPKAAEAQTQSDRPSAAMPDWGIDIDREPEAAEDHSAQPGSAPHMPRAALTETDVATGFNDFINNEFATPAVQPPPARKEQEGEFSWDAPFDDLPELPKPVAFEQALHARQEEIAKAPENKVDRERNARSELEDLIGYKSSDDGAPADEQLPPEVARAMSKLEGKSFKVHRKNKHKFNPIPIAFGVGAALIAAGGAFAAYTYREDVTALVASYMPADTSPAKTETRDIPATPAEQSKSVTVNSDEESSSKPADEARPTEVASLDTNIVPTKFTQRLLEDGTETETDAAKIPIDQSLTEGKTIAGQTVAAETEVASTDASTTTTNPVAKTEGLAVTQKMILYEERLGDSPVAVQGKVTWKLANDTSNASGKDQPMVEATVEVPERKLKAVVSFKRNGDPSLPASHIIEVVFDLPDDFAEGNVESVQRVAFKQTEQDRGNSLIAVPAKITDDFHMIALNDDADARKVNTDLMKARSWIDIPVVYRNNRRALLTFEKGSTGTEAFDRALQEWAALGPTATNN